MMIIMMIVILLLLLIIIINGNLELSFYRNIKISDTESHYTNKSHPHFWTVKECSLFTLHTPNQCRNTDCHRFSPCDPENDQEKCVIIAQNFPQYLRFRITEGLLYYNEINCNWKLILEVCVRFVAYRVKSNFYAVGVSGWVSVRHWLGEDDVKNYKNYLAVISYYKISLQRINIRTSFFENTLLQRIHSKIIKQAPFSYIN
jgi:hypothetical protein